MGFSWCGARHDSEVHSGERLSQGAVTLTALCCCGFVSENNLDFKKKCFNKNHGVHHSSSKLISRSNALRTLK